MRLDRLAVKCVQSREASGPQFVGREVTMGFQCAKNKDRTFVPRHIVAV